MKAVERSALVIDENVASRRLVSEMCRTAGFHHIAQAASTEQSMGRFAERKFDVVLCDWGIDGGAVDGLAFARQAAKHGVSLVILMKVNPSKEDVVAAREAGAKLLGRPFSTQSLMNYLKGLAPKI